MEPCPVCNITIPWVELERHVNDHFGDEDYARDLELAQQLSLFPVSPSILAEHPLDCGRQTSSSTPDTSTSSSRSVWEKCAALVRSHNKEIFHSVEGGLMTLLKNCLELNSDNNCTTLLSGHVDHFQTTKEDSGWGCGWRNIQMLTSHLLRQGPQVKDVLYGGSGFVPDIASLQRWLELAWEKGFDTHGSIEFDNHISGQRKWIGTTECAALLRSFGLRAMIVDFSSKDSSTGKRVDKRKITQVYGPMDIFLSEGKLDLSLTVPSGNRSCQHSSFLSEKGHEVLTKWVWDYFSDNNLNKSGNHCVVVSQKPPLYFQHYGHSRTIVGIQSTRHWNGKQKYNMLIFDPGEKTRALERSLRANTGWQKLIKRGVHTLKEPQYQVGPAACCALWILELHVGKSWSSSRPCTALDENFSHKFKSDCMYNWLEYKLEAVRLAMEAGD